MKIYAVEKGAPSDIKDRLDREKKTYKLLEQLNIEYTRADHDPAATVDECEEVDRALDVKMCKNLFLCNRQKTDFYLVMTAGEKRFSSKEFAQKMGISRVSFAEENFLKEYLDVFPGAVTVLGLANDGGHKVKLVIDKCVAEAEYIGCHPCVNTSSLKVKSKDITEKLLPYTGHKPTVLEL